MSAVQKKKIAILFPIFLGGGAESVCAWMLESLKSKYELTLFSLAFPGFSKLNHLYGTSLRENEVKLRVRFPGLAGKGLVWFFLNIHSPQNEFQRWTQDYFKKYLGEFDLAISAYNQMELGRPGIQYVHWPFAVHERFSPDALWAGKKNITLVNSQFTARKISERFGAESQVLYPPIIGVHPVIPYEDRECGFVCIGRLVKAKEPHHAISILKKVRARGHEVSLHLVGSQGEYRYIRFLKKLQKENASWVRLHINLSRGDLDRLLSRNKFGIHWKVEPFGMTIGEMVQAGCTPFVKDKGGQTEIVDGETSLMFCDENQAADRIAAILEDPLKQKALNAKLRKRIQRFSAENFKLDLNRAVENALEK